MSLKNILVCSLSLYILAEHQNLFASELKTDVAKYCRIKDFPILRLSERDRSSNIGKIQKTELGKTKTGKFLTEIYQKIPSKEVDVQVKKSNMINRKVYDGSVLRKIALKWTTRKSRISDPVNYVKDLSEFIKISMPSSYKKLNNFNSKTASNLLYSRIQPAQANQTGFYGAVAEVFEDSKTGKVIRLITISNNESEPIPYLATLLMHEIAHGNSWFDRRLYSLGGTKSYEEAIIDEARAFDEHLKAYLEGVKSHPSLFCNWIYPSWLYGEILIPLSWTMHSMEVKARDGSLIDQYTKTPFYRDANFLIEKNSKRLRKDLRERINKENLKYVRYLD